MNWTWVFFSFQGRLARKPFWIGLAAPFGLALFGALFIWIVGSMAASPPIIALEIAFAISISVLCLALGSKRLQDRDKSGWWILPYFFVPQAIASAALALPDSAAPVFIAIGIAVAFCALLDLGCLEGTPGRNRFGTDPNAPVPVQEKPEHHESHFARPNDVWQPNQPASGPRTGLDKFLDEPARPRRREAS
ncbi:DUF805 domain-containing protein [Flaviflagellibacter deserti]|jgi:uncharacterized membrane protein YhaH (DUF805 family)|uniref:DUF805 domain-containing protein n=1 Tax=Flaviflagellibacter deserti TaxID=2267266 RepID=A0ABV9Z057_9HYPH